MHHAVLHNEPAEATTDTINDTPPSFPLLSFTHQNSKLPKRRKDKEDEPQFVSLSRDVMADSAEI